LGIEHPDKGKEINLTYDAEAYNGQREWLVMFQGVSSMTTVHNSAA
jgi:hypothetical protein